MLNRTYLPYGLPSRCLHAGVFGLRLPYLLWPCRPALYDCLDQRSRRDCIGGEHEESRGPIMACLAPADDSDA
eukprot:3854172-Pyramimonas_sp.AAC.2